MGKKLMIKKLSAVFAVLFLAVSATLVLEKPAEAFDSSAKPVMLNRTAISLGDPSKVENIFYDKDTANDNMVWQNYTKGCYSDIELTSYRSNTWTLRASEKLPDGTCGPEKETILDPPTNWVDRQYVVFYKGSDDTINSVKADVDNTFINTGLGKHDEADAIYIERDDMNPYDCPSLIIDQGNGDGWIYVMMRRASDQGNASEQYSALMRELGSKSFFPGSPDMSVFDEGKGLCEVVPADGDDDKDKILNYYGLPGSYYNTRAGNENRETVDLGFSGSKLGGFDLHKMFGPDAAGMALKGPLAGGFIASGELEAGGAEGDDAPICSAGALGWVLCPLSEAMVGAIEGIANLLESFLVFQPLTTSEQGKAIKAIWSSLLGIANAGLIIAFLVVVFSQATSIGLNNYGIKKLLPRVIAAAILMNLSFYLCAIAVDISNILGVSIKGIVDVGLDAVTAGINNPELKANPSVGDWIAISTVGLLGSAILVGTGAIFLLIPVLISGLMAVLTAFLILAARQVLITLLIIVAPLAILAWILPNTESWFTKWRKLFTTLLLLYPMVMAIFYGAILVSSVILASAGDSGNAINNWTVQILAFLVLVVPLFSLPFVMKAAGGVMDRLGVLVNNRNKGLVDRSRKKSQELQGRTTYQRGKELRKRAADEYRGTKFASRVGKGGFAGIKARGIAGNIGRLPVAQDSAFGAQNSRLGSYAIAAEREAATKRRQSIVAGLRSEGIDMKKLQERYLESVSGGDIDSANAQLSHLSTAFGGGGRQLAAEALAKTNLSSITDEGRRQKMATELDETIGSELYSSLIGSRADIAKGGFRGGDTFGFTDISTLTAPQIASQDKGVHEMGAARGQAYDAGEAHIAMTNPELISKISDKGTRQELSRRSGVPIKPDDNSTTNENQEIIIPRSTQPRPSANPTPTQQQRQAGGNFNGGPGQNPPDSTP